jgi:hypothetical protein
LSPNYKARIHWVAVNIIKNNAIKYFDSFKRDSLHQFLVGIKLIINKLHPTIYMKLKINRIIEQRTNSSTCGILLFYFAK